MGENVAYSVLGRANFVHAPSHVHPLINVVRIDIIDNKSDCNSVLTKVDQRNYLELHFLGS